MSKAMRVGLAQVEMLAATDKGYAARVLAPMHRAAMTASAARACEDLAARLSLPVRKVNGCLVAE